MTTEKFESLLDRCCEILTAEARSAGFHSSKHFEDRVREVLSDLTADDASIEIDFNSPAQAFPDIAMGEYGVEVKYTTADTWRSIANSVLETQRVEGVRYIYVVFGKMAVCRKFAGESMRQVLSMSAHPMFHGLRLR
jgi:hypothetical protein